LGLRAARRRRRGPRLRPPLRARGPERHSRRNRLAHGRLCCEQHANAVSQKQLVLSWRIGKIHHPPSTAMALTRIR
jgi:hypothetical protein